MFQNGILPERTKTLLKKWRGAFKITEVHQQSWFYPLSTRRAEHYENVKHHFPSPEDWCAAQNMNGLEYLLVEPACEINVKGTMKKNDGNKNMSMDDNERTRAGRGANMDRIGQAHDNGNKERRAQKEKYEVPQVRRCLLD